jgi:hypothetical protein
MTKESTDSKPLAVQLAKASWVAPLLVVVMNMLLKNVSVTESESVTQSVVFTVFAVIFFIAGFVSGVVALFGIPKHGWRGILIPALIGVLVSGAMIGVVVSNVRAAAGKHPQVDVETAIENIKASLPRMIDESTEFSNAYAEPGKVVFEYTFPEVPVDDIDIDAFVSAVEPELFRRYCSDMEIYWQNGFDFGVTYTSGDGVRFAEVSLASDDCDSIESPK